MSNTFSRKFFYIGGWKVLGKVFLGVRNDLILLYGKLYYEVFYRVIGERDKIKLDIKRKRDYY